VLWYFSLAMVASLRLVTQPEDWAIDATPQTELMPDEVSAARPGISLG
jgi:hypothetical protein